MNSQYFSGTMYGFKAIGGPFVVKSSSIRLVLPISVAVWDMILAYLMSCSSFSLSLVSSGVITSGINIDKWLASGSNCRLVLLGIL